MDWLARYFVQMMPGQQLSCLLAGGNNLPCSSHLAHLDTTFQSTQWHWDAKAGSSKPMGHSGIERGSSFPELHSSSIQD